ncbi:Protein C12orf4 homolog [Eumeta japonica]|uniref:Protein C12orf4 homolog n=1 Tax=Eumeta variegata TaxID=151549 RepID=A0A4C1UR43_EUMVA|nr:Protein C12orf4 homolog [Eumeta japonica]
MTAESDHSVTKVFQFSFPTCTNEELRYDLEVPIKIPYSGSTKELVQRILNMFHIPVYLEEELNEELAKFVSKETKTFHNDRDEKLLNQLKNGEINVDGIVKSWEKLFKENVIEYAEQKGTSDEEVFAAAYHKLVHSPALNTILQVESSYANTVINTLNNRDEDIKKLTQRQTEEIEEKVRQVNTGSTEEEVNVLAGKQFEEQSLVAGRWGSQLDALWQTQRAQYRAWLMSTLEEYQGANQLNTPTNSPLATFSMSERPITAPPQPPPAPELAESFTIHLGSQLKQTHNIRIVSMDMLDLCRVERQDNSTETSRRLQTALGLYSTELCAAVLLAESAPPRHSPLTKQFTDVCRRSTEYHFPDVDQQLRTLMEKVKEPAEKRNETRYKQQPEWSSGGGGRARESRCLQTGDVYVTRHSNLAEVHVVFHLLVDEGSLRSGDINSRHPAILGLRNIIKAACANDVTSISLPVLLRHDLSDEMTAAWCTRRAELVLKCVKGFMLETASWGGAELKNLQLVVPAGIDERVFASLAALLPAIFRISNPLKFKAST